ncbi:MAG: YraN family protein [Chloroflexi bacterium]|nr:YraN family protein [Chloroflexota bacterium]
METAQQRRGRRAEALACESLRAAGWMIIQRNVRVAGLEIDLLARDERRLLVAVEVRARLRVGEQSPRALLGARKVAALVRQREALPELCRIDLLLVIGPPNGERLRLVRGIAERGAPAVRGGTREGGRICQHPIRGPLASVREYARGTCRLATVAPRGRDGVPRWHNRVEENYGRSYDARTFGGRRPLWAPDPALEPKDGAFHLRPAQWDPHP